MWYLGGNDFDTIAVLISVIVDNFSHYSHRSVTFIILIFLNDIFPLGIYLLKVNNGNTRIRSKIYSKLTIRTLERSHWRSSVFIVNFEHISHLVLVFLLLTLNM